ncbi:MAG: glycosyltransferase [Myxococcota bacterium]
MPLFGPSGASEHLRAIVRALRRAGHDVRLSVGAMVDARGRWGEPVGGPIALAPRTRWPRGLRTLGAGVDAAAGLRRATADGWRPDWIWERHALTSGVPGFAARVGARWLIEVNAPVVQERRAAGAKVRGRVERRAARRVATADRVIAVSTWLANWAVGRGAASHRVRVVPNGVEPAVLEDRIRARHRLPVPDSARIVIGFVGSFRQAHGVEQLPAIVDELGEDAWLVTVGTGPVTLPAHRRIVALGQVPPQEVGAILAGFDVGVAPYTTDAPPWFSPLKLLAYRAQGVPVVTGPLPEAPRLLGGEGGEIVHSGKIGDWVAAIRRQAGRHPRPAVRTWDDVVTEALRA